ncbi:MAG: ACP S-malonyltransferase [Clostridiales Family XIII bacterium]|jgi:[acyl-carrier-protein] S-malonyltransferase|nr:ACP S-malonyltransferase [Clostridiales Family XIII bacterium]
MAKIAILFSGQGAQYPGMGKDLYDVSPAAKAVFDAAGDDIKEKSFFGTKEELSQTQITQPTVFAVEVAAYEAFKEAYQAANDGNLPEIAATAGFSLGEFGAYTAAGVIPTISEATSLIKTRANLMMESGKYDDGSPRGGMLAALGKKDDILTLVEKVRGDDVLEGVNFNGPTQTVIAGDKAALERFAQAAADKANNVKRAIPLSVSTAFHSEIMNKASVGLAEAVKDIEFEKPAFDIYLNATGDKLDLQAFSSDTIRQLIVTQVKSPVQWQKTIEQMVSDGIDTVIEFGPGSTLTGLVKKITKEIKTYNVSDAETLNATVEAISAL